MFLRAYLFIHSINASSKWTEVFKEAIEVEGFDLFLYNRISGMKDVTSLPNFREGKDVEQQCWQKDAEKLFTIRSMQKCRAVFGFIFDQLYSFR